MFSGRRSVRKYTDEPVSKEQESCSYQQGPAPPAPGTARPWEFIVVRDRGRLAELSTVRQYWGMLKNAALSIVVCANLRDYPGTHKDFFVQEQRGGDPRTFLSLSDRIAGSVRYRSAAILPRRGRRAFAVSSGVPEDIIPFSVISIGHPAEHAKPHPEIAVDRVHHEQY